MGQDSDTVEGSLTIPMLITRPLPTPVDVTLRGGDQLEVLSKATSASFKILFFTTLGGDLSLLRRIADVCARRSQGSPQSCELKLSEQREGNEAFAFGQLHTAKMLERGRAHALSQAEVTNHSCRCLRLSPAMHLRTQARPGLRQEVSKTSLSN